MELHNFFVISIMVEMVSLAVTASVVAHRESIERLPAEKFLSAATISYGSENICGGIILNKRWIITSARSLENHTAPELVVDYGSHDRNSMQQNHSKVEQILFHPKYRQERLINNVALIKVKSDIEFSSTVQAATLPTTETEEDELAYAIGWEKLNASITSNGPEMLKYYQTKVMALDLCWERLEDLDAVKVNDNVICTFGPPEDVIVALEHGSALVSIDKNELIGIGSWYQQGYPNVYARVRPNIPWIKTVIVS